MENKGIFLYLDSISALDKLYSDAQKWRIVRALVMYAVLDELPDEKMQKNAVFLLLKSMVDNGKMGQKRKRGGESEKEVESLDNRGSKACDGDSEKGGESAIQYLPCGEEKLTTVFDDDLKNKHNKNKNKNKNENKNKNKKSSSSLCEVDGCGEEIKKIKVEEEERKVSLVSKPTLKEVKDFIEITKVNVDAVCFYEYHVAKDWRVGGRNISDWRACVLEWDRRERRKAIREKEKEEEKRRAGLTREYTSEDKREIEDRFISLEDVSDVSKLLC